MRQLADADNASSVYSFPALLDVFADIKAKIAVGCFYFCFYATLEVLRFKILSPKAELVTYGTVIRPAVI